MAAPEILDIVKYNDEIISLGVDIDGYYVSFNRDREYPVEKIEYEEETSADESRVS
jgi:hypothetical protein